MKKYGGWGNFVRRKRPSTLGPNLVFGSTPWESAQCCLMFFFSFSFKIITWQPFENILLAFGFKVITYRSFEKGV
jgi:hypothetical protein